MTRALIALFRGNPERYFTENPFALFTLAAVWALIHVKNKAIKCVSIALLAVNLACFVLFR